jgi:hypothetical protein
MGRTEGLIINRFLIIGVPRSGKSRLALRLARAKVINHYPVDSLVSAIGEAYPDIGVGRQFEDAMTTASLAPLLLKWIRHLDYEGTGYVLESYHISVDTAEILSDKGFRVAALGYASVDVDHKCRAIRAFETKGDWTVSLTDSALADLVVRFKVESAHIQEQCERHGLAYFDVGTGSDDALEPAFVELDNGV